MNPWSPAVRRTTEADSYPTTVALFQLPCTLKCKPKPDRSLYQLESELLMMDSIEDLGHAVVPLCIAGHRAGYDTLGQAEPAGGERVAQERAAPRQESDGHRRLHLRDAILPTQCDDLRYGDFATDYIVTPSLLVDFAPVN